MKRCVSFWRLVSVHFLHTCWWSTICRQLWIIHFFLHGERRFLWRIQLYWWDLHWHFLFVYFFYIFMYWSKAYILPVYSATSIHIFKCLQLQPTSFFFFLCKLQDSTILYFCSFLIIWLKYVSLKSKKIK